MTRPTRLQIAASYDLWLEYVDPQRTHSIEDFQALTIDEKLALMAEVFGPED